MTNSLITLPLHGNLLSTKDSLIFIAAESLRREKEVAPGRGGSCVTKDTLHFDIVHSEYRNIAQR